MTNSLLKPTCDCHQTSAHGEHSSHKWKRELGGSDLVTIDKRIEMRFYRVAILESLNIYFQNLLNGSLHIDLWYFELPIFFGKKPFNLLFNLILFCFVKIQKCWVNHFKVPLIWFSLFFVPLISCLVLHVPFCPEILLFINAQPLSHFLSLHVFIFSFSSQSP